MANTLTVSYDHVAGAASFIKLWQHAKEATENQRAIFNKFNPFEASLSQWVKNKIEGLFNQYVKKNVYYEGLKKYTFQKFFPNTQSLLSTITWIERRSKSIEKNIYFLTRQRRRILYIELIAITILFGCGIMTMTLNPVKLLIIGGFYVLMIKNHAAFLMLLGDFQLCTQIGRYILKKPLEARQLIKNFRKTIVEKAYPKTDKTLNPQTYHLKSVIHLLSKTTFGEKENFKEKIDNILENHGYLKIRNFEKKQRLQFLSSITDTFLKRLAAMISTQIFNVLVTYLIGVLVISSIYWITNYTINYAYLTSAIDLIKWTFRFYSWNVMIRVWEVSREDAIKELLTPIFNWNQTRWERVTARLQQTPSAIHAKILGIFTAISQKLTFSNQKRKGTSSNLYSHLPPDIAFDSLLT